MTTETLFRDDSYLDRCRALVVAAGPAGIVLDRTVFYAMGGGQPGDTGTLSWAGRSVRVVDTVKGEEPGTIVHRLEADAPLPPVGAEVEAAIDRDRRLLHMRMHTALHLLCASVTGAVTGGQIGAERSRLDFAIASDAIDRAALTEALNGHVAAALPIATSWITDAEMAARPELVRTMSVKPPTGSGHVRLVRIGAGDAPLDLQPCGGTHVRHTGDVGRLEIVKIENKGRRNRRIVLALA
jgi:misacylated tRNA(Ala) deacylase